MKIKANGESTKKILGIISKYKYVLIVILAGIILLSLQSGGSKKEAEEQPRETSESFDITSVEEKLENILSKIEGVGKVRVMLTLKNSGEQTLANNTDISAGYGGDDQNRRIETVVISSPEGGETPVVIKKTAPEYLGAVVVCQGGGNTSIQMTVIQAISALTGLGSNRIHVAKMS